MMFFTDINEIWYAGLGNTITSRILLFLDDLSKKLKCAYTCYKNVQKCKYCFKIKQMLFTGIVFSYKSCTYIKYDETCHC